jgi:hypothetical protein
MLYRALGIGIGVAVNLALIVGLRRLIKVDELPTHELEAQMPPRLYPYAMALFLPVFLVSLICLGALMAWLGL